MRFSRLRSDMLRVAALTWPMLIGQLAVVSYGVIDTAMTSRFSTIDLAALSISISIYLSIFVGLNGVLQALSPSIGQLFGAQQFPDIGKIVKQGMWLASFLTIIGSLLLFFPQILLSISHGSPELNEKATLYLRIIAFCLPATLGFRIYSALNNALGRPKMVMAIQMSGLLLKLPLNHLFIFGGFGIPAMGGAGCAAATTIITWMMLAASWIALRNVAFYEKFHLFGTGFHRPDWRALGNLLALGLPMGLSYLIEVTAFTSMALFVARLGAVAVSGHQLTANLGTILYMLPLSIAVSTSSLTAQAIGAGNKDEARQMGNAGLMLTLVLAFPLGLFVWVARLLILHAYTSNQVIIDAALPLFSFISIYHLFDAIQVTLAFTLRAYKIAVVPTIIYAISLWGIGIGGGYVLGFNAIQLIPESLHGASGFWFASTVANAAVALGLYCYLRDRQKHYR